MKIAIVSLAVLVTVLLSGESVAAQKKVVCYYTNWAAYRKGAGKFTPDDIDASLCTHILYSFLVIRGNQMVIHDKWLDVDNGYFNKVVSAKKQNPGLKVMAAIGGWENGSGPFSKMARSATARKQFIQSVLDILIKYNFDGLDLDWEYPGLRGGDPSVDKQNFNLLIQELQTAFKNYGRQHNKPKPLLSAAVGPVTKTANVAYDKGTICRDLDFVNLMQYDIHGAWDMETGYLAPLRNSAGETTPQNVIATTTKGWIDAGCARDKLILGMPLYGRGWKTSSTNVPAKATGKSALGKYTAEAGMLGYYEICEKLSGGWKENYNSAAEQAIAHGNGELVTYDNERSVKAKVDYINQEQLGGAMVWALDFDDFTGRFCNRGKYPLLKAINKQLGMAPGPRARTTRPPRRTAQRPQTTRRPRPTPPQKITQAPYCTKWWCPGGQTAPARRTTTRAPKPKVTPKKPSQCMPPCGPSTWGKYQADRCNEMKYHVCTKARSFTFSCAAGTKFGQSCSCCVHKRRKRRG